jgi:glutamate racemase
MTKHAIGIFDSGIGGISIWKEIIQLLPHQKTIYLADSKNAPYGQKSKKEIIALCKKNTEYLLKKGCTIIVVACNTATTNAIQLLRDSYDIPFIGIEPAIKPAAFKTATNTIGILATKGTLNSRLFAETSKKYMDGIHVIEQIGEGLVPLIENGALKSKETTALLEKYIRPMLLQNIDCLVLGCTHYPFLIPQIKKITGASVQIIDSGLAVAKQTKAILKQQGLSDIDVPAQHLILSNGNVSILQEIVNGIANTRIIQSDF